MSASQAAWAPDVDLYADLELHQTATQEDIKKSYKRLALKYHPDKQKIGQAVDTAPFRKVQEAYDILSNEDSRRRYDARGSYQNRNIFRRRQEEKEEEDWIRRRRENIRANAKALASMKAMDKLLKKAEKEAKEHARNTRHLQAERRSQAAIRRRQKEADHMARLRLQQQNEAEQRHEHTAQDQTQSEAHEPPPHQPRAQQHAASVRAPVSPPREKTTMNGGSQGSGGDDDIRRLSPCEGEQSSWSNSQWATNAQHTAQLRGQTGDSNRLPCGCTAGIARSGLRNCDFCAKPRLVAYHCIECRASACSVCKVRFC